MAALEYTDAAFTAGTPFLKLLKPTLLLPLFAGETLGVMARNRYPVDTHLVRLGFISGWKEAGICGYLLGSMSEPFDMLLQTGSQQGGVGRPLVAHLVMRNNLVLHLLNQDQFAEFIRLIRLALADHLAVRLRYAEQFPGGLGIATSQLAICILVQTARDLSEWWA
jgi:hypothetical protein